MTGAMRLMPLLLACLMMGQAMAARNLHVAADPTKKQFLQVAVTFSGKCSDVAAARLLRDNLVADVKAYFVGANKQSVADSVTGRLDTVCKDIKEGTSDLAGFRSAVSWVGLDNRDDQTTLFRGAKRNACTGGISPALYPKLLAAVKTAKYTIKYNQAGQWNPNIARGPIPYVDATNCAGTPPPPPPASPTPASPAPTPASPAPASPTPASPTPAPASPSPAPLNCSALVPNSVDDGTGKCVCTGPGFLVSAYNGTTLAACLASPASACPTAYPIPAKDGSGAIQQCLANIDTCPTQYPFQLVAGNPAAIVECRPAGTACTISGFNLQITDFASGSVVGCVKNDGQCPSAYPVAYREALTSYQLQRCDNAPSCPAWTATTTTFTTPARTAAGKLVGCFTTDYVAASNAGTCPSLPSVNFPINVVGTNPDSTAVIKVKTLQCLALNSTCPASSPVQLFAQTTAGAPPTVVSCALISILVNGQCSPNPLTGYPVATGPYAVNIVNGDQLIGCSASTSTCPVAYPFPAFSSGSTISSCSPTGSTTTCPSGSTPAKDIAGNTVACLGNAVTSCPSNYPIEVRLDTGVIQECRAQGATCPTTVSTFPYYAATQAGQPAILKQCWPPLLQGSDCSGAAGFTIPIYTNDTTTSANLVGCVASAATTTECPAAYPVPYRTGAGVLAQCRPSTVKACPNVAGLLYATPVWDATRQILGCIDLTATPTSCAAVYPVTVKQLSATGYIASNAVACMPKGTTTCASGFGFSLYNTGSSPAVLEGCINAQVGAVDCNTVSVAGSPGLAGAIIPYTGVALTNSGIVVGCTTATVAACPSAYPFAYWKYTAGWAISSCGAQISTTCANANGNTDFKVNGRDASGKVVACIDSTAAAAGNGCPTAYLTAVSPAATGLGSPTDCLAQGATCPTSAIDYTTGNSFQPTFPLYKGAIQPNTLSQLAGCVPVVKSSSTGAPVNVCGTSAPLNYYGTFLTPVYSDAAGTILAGCLDGQLPPIGTLTTPCPTGTFPIFNAVGVAILECRGARTDCTFPNSVSTSGVNYATYKVLIKDAAGAFKGCQEQAVATVCPVSTTLLPLSFAFTLYGPNGVGIPPALPAPQVVECRPVPAVITAGCTGAGYAANYPVAVTGGALTGCLASGVLCPVSLLAPVGNAC